MKTINIKGKEYVTVNERLKEFRNLFKDYSLITEIVELGADYATIKASVIDEKGIVRATGFAREVVAKSPINKYAFLENCETSAIGRALGNFGIGIDDAVCTADELLMKLAQNDKSDDTSSSSGLTRGSHRSEFEQAASKEKAAATKALNKAVATGEKYQKPVASKSLTERYSLCSDFLSGQTPETFKRVKPSVIDSTNSLIDDLYKGGCDELALELTNTMNRLLGISDDSIPE